MFARHPVLPSWQRLNGSSSLICIRGTCLRSPRRHMRKVVFALFVFALSLSTILSAQVSGAHAPEAQAPSGPSLKTIAVGEIHTGMRGVAYTVFQGIKPEAMDVEVLGVLRNVNGPKGDVILARLHGTKVEYTGVVAGMSGSPVYIDGKLVGAIAYRIGSFSKEPIAGVTPAASMLEIDGMDKSGGDIAKDGGGRARQVANQTSGPGLPDASASPSGYTNLLKPIDTPLVFSGFSAESLRMFSKDFSSA